MPAFLAIIPLWLWVVAAMAGAYLLYRYWRYRRSIAYSPNIVRGKDSDFTSNRENSKYKGG
jgi:hypothetical protein